MRKEVAHVALALWISAWVLAVVALVGGVSKEAGPAASRMDEEVADRLVAVSRHRRQAQRVVERRRLGLVVAHLL
ncbi:hypothetical protein [Streptomyces recifensis]|uniref:hypothetical protein n=1 Tax=Streptomyces recifensis TaxID=67355 RepID=UPI000A3CBDE6|nr:hypothetical protein [Streptomyces recifensis]